MIGGLAVDRTAAFSFTRASSKLAQDSTGPWRSFADNVPDITDRGILLEPERQNTVINSTALEGWNLLRAAVTPNTGPGLDASNEWRRPADGDRHQRQQRLRRHQ